MRKAYLLFTLLCITFAACKKNTNNKPTTYVVNNVTDLELTQGETDAMDLDVQYVGPVQENVWLSVEGLPTGITVDFTRTGGIPSFSTTAVFQNNSAVPGVYPCQLVSHGDQTGDKYYDFDITVKAQPICGLLANYTGSTTCDSAGVTYSETITAAQVPIENAVNPVRFENFGGVTGRVVIAQVNCADNTIQITAQPVGGGAQISGNGTFTSTGTITINYTITQAGFPTNCTLTLTRTN